MAVHARFSAGEEVEGKVKAMARARGGTRGRQLVIKGSGGAAVL